MRNGLLYASIALLLGATALTAAEFEQVHRGIPHDALYDLCLVGQQGLAVGAAGLVLETTDGGRNWKSAAPFTEAALLGLACTQDRSIAVAQEGLIFVREPGAWRQVDSGSELRLLSVDMNANGLVVAVGGFGAVLRSTDYGESWETLSFDWEAIINDFLEPHLYSVDVSDDGVVTVVGEFELVIRSTDGGESWETVNLGEASLFSLHLRADGQGFAVGQNGTVLKTQDGGVTWARIETGYGANLLDVRATQESAVIVSGIRATLHSSDGGNSWSRVETGDFNTAWYQTIEVADADGAESNQYLFAGHTGRIVKLTLN